MAGYNPVSGGLLNMITGGKYGKPTQTLDYKEHINKTLIGLKIR
jgi:hypothetical protein